MHNSTTPISLFFNINKAIAVRTVRITPMDKKVSRRELFARVKPFGPIEHITFRPVHKEALITFQRQEDAESMINADVYIRRKRVAVHGTPYQYRLNIADEPEPEIDLEHLGPTHVLKFDNHSITTIRNVLFNFGHFVSKLHLQGITGDYFEMNYMFDVIHFYCMKIDLLILESMSMVFNHLMESKLAEFFQHLTELDVRNSIIGYDQICSDKFPPNSLQTLKFKMVRNYEFLDKILLRTFPQLTHFEIDLKPRTADVISNFLLCHREQLKTVKLNRFNANWYTVPVGNLSNLNELWLIKSVCGKPQLLEIGKKLRNLKLLNFLQTDVTYDEETLNEINSERQEINATKVEIYNYKETIEHSVSDDAVMYDYNDSHVCWFTPD